MKKKQNSKTPKINKIFDLLNQHYCFTQEEIDQYKENTLKMKEEGLDSFIALLEKSKEKQDSILLKKIDEDPTFPTRFLKFIRNTTKKLQDDFEVEEKEQAEEILKDL